MTYIKYTYVDYITGISSLDEPIFNGPKAPEGVKFDFALESKYPTNTPIFYGTTSGDTKLNGILAVLSKEEYDEAYAKELKDREFKHFVPASLLRQRAMKVGIWSDLAAYIVQYPELMLMVLTLEVGIDPHYPALIDGFNSLEVPQDVQDYLLSDPSLGV